MARKAAAAKRRSKSGSVSVNWGEAELNNYVTRAGTYSFKVTAAEEGDNDNVIVTSEVTSEGKQLGKSIKTYFGLAPKQLWVLGRFLEAVGQEIPEDEADLDLEELVDLEYVATIEEDEYDGKTRLRIAANSYDAIDAAEDAEEEKPAKKGRKSKAVEEEEEEEKPARGKKGKKAPKKFDKETVEEMDRDDLIELIADAELDVEPDDFKKLPKLLEAVVEEMEEKDLFEEAEEEAEEEEAPKAKRGRKPRKGKGADDDEKPTRGKSSRGATKKGKLPKVAADDLEDMNEEELDDLVEKYDLDADLSKAKTLRKKAALVLDALEAADLLEAA